MKWLNKEIIQRELPLCNMFSWKKIGRKKCKDDTQITYGIHFYHYIYCKFLLKSEEIISA